LRIWTTYRLQPQWRRAEEFVGVARQQARLCMDAVERWEHLLLDRTQDQRAQQPVADTSERPAAITT
jgi:hypothetical protein